MNNKYNKPYKIALFAIIVVLANISCTSNFEKLNTPPKSALYVDPALLLTEVQRWVLASEAGETPNNIAGSWIHHWAGGQILGQSRYIPQPFNIMGGFYAKLGSLALIKNELLNELENSSKGKTKLAIVKIFEIYTWQILTDLYGPIPYSESSQPLNNIIIQPKYDSQEAIYISLIKELDKAIAKLNDSDESFGSADLLYGGNISLWKKFGYSLKLKLGMRIKYANFDLSKQTVESALSNSLIENNTESASIPTENTPFNNAHPNLKQFLQGSPDLMYLGEKLIEVLLSINDPRLPLIASPNKAGIAPAFRGIKVAETDAYYAALIRNQFSLASSKTYFNKNISIPLYAISYAEVCFFKAEAALEKWGGLSDIDAEQFYKEGILAAMSMEPYNILETDISKNYKKLQFKLIGTREEKLEKIMTQKWILLFSKNYEAWFEWRRTGYPSLNPGPYSGGVQTIPRRFIYPIDEPITNLTNYKQAVSTLSNGDTYLSKVWWDKK
ncbi:MAG: SusD/RagB family nutrient-binding outer membrane lipoprotein [Tenacibaculum sp.]